MAARTSPRRSPNARVTYVLTPVAEAGLPLSSAAPLSATAMFRPSNRTVRAGAFLAWCSPRRAPRPGRRRRCRGAGLRLGARARHGPAERQRRVGRVADALGDHGGPERQDGRTVDAERRGRCGVRRHGATIGGRTAAATPPPGGAA
jgi:hypothetical protein